MGITATKKIILLCILLSFAACKTTGGRVTFTADSFHPSQMRDEGVSLFVSPTIKLQDMRLSFSKMGTEFYEAYATLPDFTDFFVDQLADSIASKNTFGSVSVNPADNSEVVLKATNSDEETSEMSAQFFEDLPSSYIIYIASIRFIKQEYFTAYKSSTYVSMVSLVEIWRTQEPKKVMGLTVRTTVSFSSSSGMKKTIDSASRRNSNLIAEMLMKQ